MTDQNEDEIELEFGGVEVNGESYGSATMVLTVDDKPYETGEHTITYGDIAYQLEISDNNIAVRAGGEYLLHIPHDDGVIPRQFGNNIVISKFMDELKDLGFECSDEFGYEEDRRYEDFDYLSKR